MFFSVSEFMITSPKTVVQGSLASHSHLWLPEIDDVISGAISGAGTSDRPALPDVDGGRFFLPGLTVPVNFWRWDVFVESYVSFDLGRIETQPSPGPL